MSNKPIMSMQIYQVLADGYVWHLKIGSRDFLSNTTNRKPLFRTPEEAYQDYVAWVNKVGIKPILQAIAQSVNESSAILTE